MTRDAATHDQLDAATRAIVDTVGESTDNGRASDVSRVRTATMHLSQTMCPLHCAQQTPIACQIRTRHRAQHTAQRCGRTLSKPTRPRTPAPKTKRTQASRSRRTKVRALRYQTYQTQRNASLCSKVALVSCGVFACAERKVLDELRKWYAAQDRRASQKSSAQSKDKKQQAQGASVAEIPRFYVQRTTSPAPEPDAAMEVPEGADPALVNSMPRSSLPTQVRRESRTRYLESRAEQLLDDRELAMLWDNIQLHSVDVPTSQPNAPSPPPGSGTTAGGSSGSPAGMFELEKRLHYDAFLLIARSLPPAKAARYFKPTTFLSFPQDLQGRISSRALWRFISRKIQLTRLRISLTCYDDIGYGYLREQDLENYVYDQLGSLPPLASVERDFYPYYVFTAVRKFIFTLDTARRGKLRIKDITYSQVMLEFDALRYPAGSAGGGAGMGGGSAAAGKKGGAAGGGGSSLGSNSSFSALPASSPSPASLLSSNSWFSAHHTQEVYSIYLSLDSNQNGMLSREEFQAYNGGNLTPIFIQGLFAEYRMYPSSSSSSTGADGGGEQSSSQFDESDPSNTSGGGPSHELEMDYKTFLDFVLAMEYKSSPASIAYFFRILDQDHRGFLDARNLSYWFRAVSEKMAALGHEPVNVEVVAVSGCKRAPRSCSGRRGRGERQHGEIVALCSLWFPLSLLSSVCVRFRPE